jgi:methylmalonyl-CoA carboxyltransferase large subunit
MFQDVSPGMWLMALALIMMTGWGLTYLAIMISHRRKLDDLRREMREMEERLNAAVSSARAQSVPEAPRPKPAPAAQITPGKQTPSSAKSAPPVIPEVTPEMLIVIAAAVTAFLGKKVRVRSAKLLETPYELFNPWAQQGRAIVQASHNLGQRSH